MGAEVYYSFKAECDLEKIIDYTLNEWGALQAEEYIDGLESRAKMLAENPDMGMSNILNDVEIFAFPYRSHMLFYLKAASGISVVRILHQTMLPEKYL